ncbi:IclR family transcriptional regulator [Streptomyces sp. NPDC093252]|uniref:IclR family transcriptional regulator n=1 Tax=Streptomyces sp. NPDC093252 TaxID=3154980 RepID=UPI0034435145
MLAKAVVILGCFAPEGGSFRLTELVERSGLTKTTVHRLTAQMVGLGLLDREGDTYHLGPRLFELGSLVPRRTVLREAAVPFLEDLYEATHETIHLGVRDGHDVVYVERVHGHRALALPSRIGGRLPLTCTAVGKALLAFSGGDVADEILAARLPRLTPHSVTDAARLRADLEQVRFSGVAFEDQEAALGVGCVAAPVIVDGTAVAALSVAVPRTQLRPVALATAVRTAALGLSRALRQAG